jgi:hypothetical protein
VHFAVTLAFHHGHQELVGVDQLDLMMIQEPHDLRIPIAELGFPVLQDDLIPGVWVLRMEEVSTLAVTPDELVLRQEAFLHVLPFGHLPGRWVAHLECRDRVEVGIDAFDFLEDVSRVPFLVEFAADLFVVAAVGTERGQGNELQDLPKL